MWCHLPLLAPVIGLGAFLVLPLPIAAPVYLAILVVSGIVWKKTTEAMHAPVATGAEAMVGQPGRVVSWEGHWGQVRCRDGLYRARSEDVELAPGDGVEVREVDGTTLRVVRRPTAT